MQEVYTELGYPKKTGWKFGAMVLTILVILTILIGIGVVASIPIFVRKKVEIFINHIKCRISALFGASSDRRNSSR